MMNPEFFLQLIALLELIAFLAVIGMHLFRKNKYLIVLYALQSLSVGVLLIGLGLAGDKEGLVLVGILTLLIKTFFVPLFFLRLSARFQESRTASYASSNYLSTPLTLGVLMGLVLFSYSKVFNPLQSLLPEPSHLLSLNLAIIFLSIFLLVNRQGVFAQIIGILSLENGILLVATSLGIDQPLALEGGIIFDLVLWIAIGSAFLSMIYREFRSLSTAHLKRLTED